MLLLETTGGHRDKDQDRTYVKFPDGRQQFAGWYHMRGGVCWPNTVSDKHQKAYMGALVMMGVQIATGKVLLFGVHTFRSVPDVLTMNRASVKFDGIAGFTNACWSRWYGTTFYWAGSWETHRLRLLEIERDGMILPKPTFPEVLWDDDKQAISAVCNARDTLNLLIPQPECDDLHAAILAQREHIDTPAPEVWAIACALNGIENNPPDQL